MPLPPRSKGGRSKYFYSFDNAISQTSLFAESRYSRKESLFPVSVIRDTSALYRLLSKIPPKSYFGLDFEFNSATKEAFIIGVSYKGVSYGGKFTVPIGNAVHELIDKHQCRPIAFSAIEADKEVLEANIGKTTSLDLWEDAIYTHFLCNSDLTQGKQKEEGEDSLGLMNLWIAALMAGLDVPNWKECDGYCNQLYCPDHDKTGYCALDAWGGEEVFLRNLVKMKELGISTTIYREQLRSALVFMKMSRRGIKVDRANADLIQEEIERDKDKLFEFYEIHGERSYELFNPRSPSQVLNYFAKHNLKLQSTDSKEIEKHLKRLLAESDYDIEISEVGEKYEEIVKSPLKELARLYVYKRKGKGLDSWVNGNYVNDNGLIHCRLHNIGTCNGRVSSSNPNLTNVPRVGFGTKVRKIFIPRE